MSTEPQRFSHYPAWPLPILVQPVVESEHPCAYFPQRTARMRAFWAPLITPQAYDRFMDAGFRRSGKVIYQPLCTGCRACLPIRVRVDQFKPDKSQRRCRKRNTDLHIQVQLPQLTDEKYELYCRYLRDWHGDEAQDNSRESFERFLFDSPANSVEFTYRDALGHLLAVGICDVSSRTLSSVYHFFDPAHARRGLGTFGVLSEIDYALANGLAFYYLGYWVEGCRSMEYKSSFRPSELLCTDGKWRE